MAKKPFSFYQNKREIEFRAKLEVSRQRIENLERRITNNERKTTEQRQEIKKLQKIMRKR